MTGFGRPIRVLAADDSAVMRRVFKTIFAADAGKRSGDAPQMELCGLVEDGVECLEAVMRLRPDVVLLDLEMPRMHGLDVLERLRMEEPGLPVIMCSAYTERDARTTLDALALGAAGYVMKPGEQTDSASALKALSGELILKIAALAGAGGGSRRGHGRGMERSREPRAQPGISGSKRAAAVHQAAVEAVVIGVSTGGPSALEKMLPELPAAFPVPVMIVQHMPKLFTAALAERLDRCCALRVREASDGAQVRPGTIWLAPGDAHMEVSEAAGTGVVVRLHQQRSLNHCKPSVDYLFSSAARVYGAGTLALVMTGMGEDGLTGARLVHKAGGTVLAQDAATSAVWGMPGRVYQAGIAPAPVALDELAGELKTRVHAGREGRAAAEGHAGGSRTLQRGAHAAARERNEAMHGLL